jgi:hypothetical protein
MFCFLVRFQNSKTQNTKQKTKHTHTKHKTHTTKHKTQNIKHTPQNTKHKTQNIHHTQTHKHNTHTHGRSMCETVAAFSECRFRCRWFSQKLWCSYWSYSSSDQIVFSTSWSATRTWTVLPKCDFRVFRVSLWVNHVNSCVNSCHRRTQTLTMDGAQRWPFGRAADFVDSTTWIYLDLLGLLGFFGRHRDRNGAL